MGPKKGAGGSKGTPDEFGELSKEVMIIQISDLEQKLSRMRKRCKTLEEANRHYQEQFELLEDDRRDVVTYLKRSSDMRADEMVECQERLNGIQQTREAERRMHEQQVTQMKAEFQDTKEQLSTQLTVLGGKLNTLEEFRLQKEELLNKFSLLEAKLEEQQVSQKDELYELDRKNILDKDRLKKDMLQRVNQIAADFRKVSNKQMANTTKRMMRENVSMNVTLTKVSEKTAELVEENRKLKNQHHSRQLKINMLEATELELVRKNRSHLRVIKLLNTKCNAQELILAMYEDLHDKFQKMLDEVTGMFKQCEGFQAELVTAQEHCSQYSAEISRLTSELASSEKKRATLELSLNGIAIAIQQCLQLSTSLEPYDKHEAQAKREALFSQMMYLLGTAAAIGVGRPKGEGLFQFAVKIPGHYQPGNLGFVASSSRSRMEQKKDDNLNTTTTCNREYCICSTETGSQKLP